VEDITVEDDVVLAVVPIWQTDPHPEHATGARAINQEAIDLLCPDGSGDARA